MELGKKISSLRKNKGISQELLAENSGISLRTIQRIEKGASIPRPFTLKAIADTLAVQVEALNFVEENQLHSEQEDKIFSALRLMNSSTLVVLILPLFNIILPFVLWYKNRKNSIVNKTGRRIISFQILWTLASLLILIVSHIIHYKLTDSFVSGRVPLVFFIYLLLLSINVICIIHSTIRLREEKLNIYSFVPSLF